METWYYEVVSIDGDYANLKRTDIESDDIKLVARALLPDTIMETESGAFGEGVAVVFSNAGTTFETSHARTIY